MNNPLAIALQDLITAIGGHESEILAAVSNGCKALAKYEAHVLVPREPTKLVLDEMFDVDGARDKVLKAYYKAMIEAAEEKV